MRRTALASSTASLAIGAAFLPLQAVQAQVELALPYPSMAGGSIFDL
ncbi:hypothetical protein [Novosphingobium sp. BW1]|nr:hypothetical protein [Novosphingobium sp. BW1]